MRLLHAGPDHERGRLSRGGRRLARCRTHPRGDERQSLPLRRPCRHRRGGAAGRTRTRNPPGGRMNAFDFVQPRNLDEAIAAAAAPGAAYLAGGTNLVDLMKAGVSRPTRLVHIGRLEGLDRIETLPDGAVRIGALVRNADLAGLPLIAEAALSGASAQLRNAATV